MIQLKDINLSFSNKNNHKEVIFKDFNLEIKEHLVTSIIGSSGVGKTTLMNIIAGYIKPNSGTVLFNGKLVNVPGKNRVVISQENDLFEWMTVLENLQIVSNDPNKIKEFLKMAKLSAYSGDYPKELSGGMRKRLSIIRGFVSDAECILMDEPFGSLDMVTKQNLLEQLLTIIKATNKTIILITHDIDESIYLSDEIVILADRPTKIVKRYEIPTELHHHLKTPDTADFLELRNSLKSAIFRSSDGV